MKERINLTKYDNPFSFSLKAIVWARTLAIANKLEIEKVHIDI